MSTYVYLVNPDLSNIIIQFLCKLNENTDDFDDLKISIDDLLKSA